MVDETIKEDGRKCKEASDIIISRIEIKPLPVIEEETPVKVYRKAKKENK